MACSRSCFRWRACSSHGRRHSRAVRELEAMAVTFAGEGAAMVVAIQCHGGGLTLTFGGVAVDLTMETGAQSPPTNYHTYLGFLADISGRANDDLVWNGPFGSTIPIQAAFLTADGPIEVIDWGWAAVAGNQIPGRL